MRPKISRFLSPSQRSIFAFMDRSSRWLTIYELSMLTGVSIGGTRSAVRELEKMKMVETKRRIGGFENGEREFKMKGSSGVKAREAQDADFRLFGVEPLNDKLRRILGAKRARELEQLIP